MAGIRKPPNGMSLAEANKRMNKLMADLEKEGFQKDYKFNYNWSEKNLPKGVKKC